MIFNFLASCLRLSQHDTVHARDFSVRNSVEKGHV
jgi:hypothetical protein